MRLSSVAVVSTVVLAAGLPIDRASAEDWSGFHAGIELGYGAGRDQIDEVDGDRRYFADTSGPIVGAVGGWQRQIGGLVVGVELEFAHLGQTGSTTRGDGAGGEIKGRLDVGAAGTLSGRVGALVTPETLLFGRVGGTLADLRGHTDHTWIDGGATRFSTADTSSPSLGLTLGAGVERTLTPKWVGRFEYQYTKFSRELSLPDVGPGWRHDADLHALKLSLLRRF